MGNPEDRYASMEDSRSKDNITRVENEPQDHLSAMGLSHNPKELQGSVTKQHELAEESKEFDMTSQPFFSSQPNNENGGNAMEEPIHEFEH